MSVQGEGCTDEKGMYSWLYRLHEVSERSVSSKPVTVENNLATIDYDKCKNCGMCAKECPTGAILSFRKKKAPAKKSAAPKTEAPAAEAPKADAPAEETKNTEA